jgi:hypothetical protein
VATLGTVLYVTGIMIALICDIWIVVLAFQESVLWGLGCLFLPFIGIVFAIMYWDTAGKPFLISLGGAALAFVGGLIGGA